MCPPRTCPLIALWILVSCAPAHGQGVPRLAHDLNNALATNPDSNPSFGAHPNLRGLFAAEESSAGREPWIYDPVTQTAALLLDLNPGSTGSDPRSFIDVFGVCFFTAYDGAHFGLWRSDGTPAGTHLVSHVANGPSELIAVNGRMVFAADGELWVSDGTTAGTMQLMNIRPIGHSNPVELTSIGPFGGGSLVIFSADDGAHGREPWITDGTLAGTFLLADLNPNGSSAPAGFACGGPFGATIVFGADDGVHGREPFISDGTTANTRLLADVHQTVGSDPTDFVVSGFLQPLAITFAADDGAIGREPWTSDGIVTMALVDLQPGATGSDPRAFTYAGSILHFVADDGTTGREPWIWDGNVTSILADLEPGSAGSDIDGFRAESPFSSRVFFAATTSATGREPYVSDGTSAALMVDIHPGQADSLADLGDFAGYLTSATSDVFLAARDGITGKELHRLTENGGLWSATLIGDLAPPTSDSNPTFGRSPASLRPGIALAALDDGVHGRELWSIDATTGTAQLVRDIRPGAGDADPVIFGTLRGITYLQANDGSTGRELWRSDGTFAGTWRVADVNVGGSHGLTSPVYFTPDEARGRFWFVATARGDGRELFVSDGTTAGTLQLEVNPGGPANPAELTLLDDGTLVFAAGDGVHGREPWRSDGTVNGTQLIADIFAGASSSLDPVPAQENSEWADGFMSTKLDGRVYFPANDGVVGYELWVTDGTSQGTSLFADVWAGSSSSHPRFTGRLKDRLLFSALGGLAQGRELYVTDGTLAGTSLLLDIEPTNGESSDPRGVRLLVEDESARVTWFTATTNATGRELWQTDGSTMGTFSLGDVRPGELSSVDARDTWVATLVGSSRLLWAANDGAHGNELWSSNGAPASATLHADIAPAGVSSDPGPPMLADGLWLFAANDGTTGRELWDVVTMAGSLRFGGGCPGSLGNPSIGSSGAPSVGNAAFAVTLENAPPGSLAALGIGIQPLTLPLFGCSLEILPLLTFGLPVDPSGASALPFPVPNDPALLGQRLLSQWVVLDPSGPMGFTFTRGLASIIGA